MGRHRVAVAARDRIDRILIVGVFVNAAVGFGLYFRERQRAAVSDEDFFEQLEASKVAIKDDKKNP